MRLHQHITQTAGLLTAMLLSVALSSCDNELENGGAESADNISFGLSETVSARATADTSTDGITVAHYTLRSDVSRDTLCVLQTVSDGIEGTSFAKSQYASRATPVTTMYDKFRVVAALKENGKINSQFYMNETATQSGSIWSPVNVYYWPGQNRKLRFLTWAPADVYLEDSPVYPTLDPQQTTIDYSTPINAAEQPDLVAASTDFIDNPGNDGTCTPVPLQFKHLCTAVILKTGSKMQPGTIKSVTITNVRKSGTYNFTTNEWTLNAETADYTQTLNRTMTGSEADGTPLHKESATFMLLPQSLTESSELIVEFHDNMTGTDPTLKASLKGSEWPMGKTVTYRLSISPEYELDFASEPEVQDAHYVIYPIKIKSDSQLKGGWTLTSNDPDNVTFVEKFDKEKEEQANKDIQALVDAGYWLDGYNGTSTLTSTTVGETKVYVFLKENATEKDRDITLTLKPTAEGNYETKKFSFKQYCPAWNNGIGVERIEDKDYPWGFNWDKDMKITYSMPKGWVSGIYHLLFEIFGDHSYIESTGVALAGTWKVTVDFSKVPPLKTATSSSDGKTNTWELYNFDGISEAETIMNQLESWGGKPDKTLPTNPTEFAARACAMKNKYRVEKKTNDGNTVYRPVLDQDNMVWYLPAQNEATNMNDNLSGDYWTSTAITDPGTTAYKYTSGGSTTAEDRNAVIHVRAVRKRP